MAKKFSELPVFTAMADVDLLVAVDGGGGGDTKKITWADLVTSFLSDDRMLADGKYLAADTFRARDADGVKLFDDDGNGLTIADGGAASLSHVLTLINTGLHLLDTNASHDLIVKPGSDLSADRTLTLTTGDADRTLTLSGNSTINQDVSSGATPRFGSLFINETANTMMTKGVTINQGSAVDEVFAAKSSATSHGMTGYDEDDTFFLIRRTAASSGGWLQGYSNNIQGLIMLGVSTNADNTDPPTTGSYASIEIAGAKKDGIYHTSLAADENLLKINNFGGQAAVVIKGDGEIYSNQSATVGTFDEYDDALACMGLADILAFGDLRESYKEFITFNKDWFVQNKFMPADGSMISMQKMSMLKLGAIGQLYNKIKGLQAEIKTLRLQ